MIVCSVGFFPRWLWIIAFYSCKNHSYFETAVLQTRVMTVRGSYLKLHWKIWLFIVPDKITFLTTKSGFRLVQLNCFQRHLNSLSITWNVNSGFFTQKLHRSYSINLFFIALIPLVCQMLATTLENNTTALHVRHTF